MFLDVLIIPPKLTAFVTNSAAASMAWMDKKDQYASTWELLCLSQALFSRKFWSRLTCADHWSTKQMEIEGGCCTIRVLLLSASKRGQRCLVKIFFDVVAMKKLVSFFSRFSLWIVFSIIQYKVEQPWLCNLPLLQYYCLQLSCIIIMGS